MLLRLNQTKQTLLRDGRRDSELDRQVAEGSERERKEGSE